MPWAAPLFGGASVAGRPRGRARSPRGCGAVESWVECPSPATGARRSTRRIAPCRADWRHREALQARADVAGVPLSSRYQPVFDGAGATKATWSRTSTPSTSGCSRSSATERCPSFGPGLATAVHAEEPAEVRPRLDPDHDVWAYASEREVHYPVCDDRRTRVAGRPAGDRVPPGTDARRQRPGGRPDPRPDPPDDVDPLDGFRMAVAAALLVRPALEDAGLSVASSPAAPRACTCSCRFTTTPRSRMSRRRPGPWRPGGAARPGVATTEFVREQRGGKVFVDSTRAVGATVVAVYCPRRARRPVSFPVTWARARAGAPRRLHDP